MELGFIHPPVLDKQFEQGGMTCKTADLSDSTEQYMVFAAEWNVPPAGVVPRLNSVRCRWQAFRYEWRVDEEEINLGPYDLGREDFRIELPDDVLSLKVYVRTFDNRQIVFGKQGVEDKLFVATVRANSIVFVPASQ